MSDPNHQVANSPVPQPPAVAPLAADEAARLTDFARACKAAARAVVLYPDGHPAIAATLGRIVDVTSTARLRGPLTITVLPDDLLLDGRAAPRPDRAIGELAALLHGHLDRRDDGAAGRRRRRVAAVPAAARPGARRDPRRRRHRARVDDDGAAATSSCARSTTPRCCASAPAAKRRSGTG